MDEQRFDALKKEFHAEYPEFVQFVRSHGRIILTAVLAAVVLTLGIRVAREKKASVITTAADAFVQAKSLEELESIVVDYKSTPTAPLALLSLARAYFDSGNYDMALSKYMEFQSTYADHPLAVSAELNRAACLEALGRIDEAQMGYEDFATKHAGHYLANEALFGKARCLEQKGLFTAAKTVYEDYMVANPRGGWFPRAEDALKELDRKVDAAAVRQPDTEE